MPSSHSDSKQLQQLSRGGQIACFLVIEELGAISKYLKLTWRPSADAYIDALFGGSFAQAHGRASHVHSKKATLHFDHP